MSDTRQKVIQKKLPREVYRALKNVVGEQWIHESRSVVETYSKLSIEGGSFMKKHEKDPHVLPACVVLPVSTGDVQDIVKICNRYRVPFIPFTNGQVFCNPTTQDPTLIIHFSRMAFSWVSRSLNSTQSSVWFLRGSGGLSYFAS